MENEIKVSVVIPAYNVEKYIEDCLNSVIRQTLRQIEIICVNDASTDSTSDILYEFSKIDNRIKVIDLSQNQGQSTARNIGLGISKGNYVYFLDADDMIAEDCLEKLYVLSIRHNLDICFFNASAIFENRKLEIQFKSYETIHKTVCKDVMRGEVLFQNFIENNDWSPSPTRQFFSKEFLIGNDIKFEPGILHEDTLFSFLAIIRAERVLCVPDQLYYRRFRPDSTMTSCMTSRNVKGLFICYCKALEELKKNQYSCLTERAIIKYLDSLLTTVKSTKQKAKNMTEIVFENSYMQYLFNNIVEHKEKYYRVSEKCVHTLKQASKVYIYGAGAIAEMITLQLSEIGIPVEAYVVSDVCQNPQVLLGNPVIAIDKLEEHSIVLIATAERYHKEITMKLKEQGNYEIVYAKYG